MSVYDVTLDFLRDRDFTAPVSSYGLTPRQDQLARMLRRGMTRAEASSAMSLPMGIIDDECAALAQAFGVSSDQLSDTLSSLAGLAASDDARIDIDHFRTAFGLEPAR